jgi:hypothetical protein
MFKTTIAAIALIVGTGATAVVQAPCTSTATPSTPVVVCDSQQRVVGLAVAPNPDGGTLIPGVVTVRIKGVVVTLQWTRGGFATNTGSPRYYYTSANCTGQAYFAVEPQPQLAALASGEIVFASQPFRRQPIGSVWQEDQKPTWLFYHHQLVTVGKASS